MADSLHDSPKKPKSNKYTLACSLLASLTCMLPGYDVGVSPAASVKAIDDLNMSFAQGLALLLTDVLSYLLGAATAAPTADWIGRRYTLVFSCAILFAGSTLMGFATKCGFLMVGRIVSGIGFGYAIMVAPVYSAEISLVSSRGFLTSLPEVFLNLGSLLGGVSGYGFSKLSTHLGWRFMVGLSAVQSIFICVGVLFVSESPHWLVMQGRLDEARRVLDKTSDSIEESQLRLADIKAAAGIPHDLNTQVVPAPDPVNFCGALKEFLIHPTPSIRHILATAVGIQFFQQAIGMSTITIYSEAMFQNAGVKKEIHLQLSSIAIGILGIAFGLLATYLVDKIGRRILLLYSVGGMVFSLMGVAVSSSVIQHYSDHRMLWASVMCIVSTLFCVAFFSIGIGPIAWVYSSEIFPQRLRAHGCSLAAAMNLFTLGIVTVTLALLILFHRISFGVVFFFNTGIAILAWIFFYLFLPETKGASLEEMETLFGGLGSFCKDRIRYLREWRMIFDGLLLFTLYEKFNVSLF